MTKVIFTGDDTLLRTKRFMPSSLDNFESGTVQKALGSGKFIIIRKSGEIKNAIDGFIYLDLESLEPILKKLEIPYKIVEEN